MRARMTLGAGFAALLFFPALATADPVAKNVEIVPASKVTEDFLKPSKPPAPAAHQPELVNPASRTRPAQRKTSRTAPALRKVKAPTRAPESYKAQSYKTESYKTGSYATKLARAEAAPPAQKPRPVAPALKAHINLSSQTMTVKVHGETRHVWKISSGRRGYHTPNGTWRPKWMTRMHYSKKYDNAPMPYSVFFHGGYAIHATYATGRLGSPASHGCIRLSPGNAKKFYSLVSRYGKSATRISITGSTPSYKSYAKRRKTSRRNTYTASNGHQYKPQRKRKTRYRKPKTNYAYSPSYSSGFFGGGQKYTWPGDR